MTYILIIYNCQGKMLSNAPIQPRRAQAFYFNFRKMDEKVAIEASRCKRLLGCPRLEPHNLLFPSTSKKP